MSLEASILSPASSPEITKLMKMKSQKLKLNGSLSGFVQLEFTNPSATTVCLAGTFNEWRPEATPMVALGNGRWVKQLALPPGQYEYRLVVDGEWMCDPLARTTTPNPFGGFNSVLNVAKHLSSQPKAGHPRRERCSTVSLVQHSEKSIRL